MRRNFQYAHNLGKDVDGDKQIKWWDHAEAVKKWGFPVKKEELAEPSLEIKKEEPPTPNLQYPMPSLSMDPNNYEWGAQEIWY